MKYLVEEKEINVEGLIFITLGAPALFFAYPVFYGLYYVSSFATFARKINHLEGGACAADLNCVSDKV